MIFERMFDTKLRSGLISSDTPVNISIIKLSIGSLFWYVIAVVISNRNYGRLIRPLWIGLYRMLAFQKSLKCLGCSIGTIRCVNLMGDPVVDRRSRLYQKCQTGQWSEPMLVPDEKICYLNTILPSSYCGEMPPEPECTFTGFRCIDSNSVITNTACTSQ